jgi:DNA-binding Lrp family transcriptional regulator
MAKLAFTQRDLDVLACIELRADLTATEVSRITKYQLHAVHYSLQKLLESGAIWWMPFIDVYPIGYGYYGVYCMVDGSKTAKANFLKSLSTSPHIYWVAELGGDYQFGTAIAARTPVEAARILSDLLQQSKVSLIGKSLSSRLGINEMPRRYLSTRNLAGPPLLTNSASPQVELDDIEHRMLAQLAQEKFTSYRDAARKIGIAHSTFELKLKALRKKGVLKGVRYEINPAAFGREPFKLLIFVKGLDPALRDKLQAFSTTIKEAYHFVECFGEWDFELNLEVERAQDVVAVRDRLYELFSEQIQKIVTFPIFRTLRRTRYPFEVKP